MIFSLQSADNRFYGIKILDYDVDSTCIFLIIFAAFNFLLICKGMI